MTGTTMLVHTQNKWLTVLVLSGALVPFALFTGHVTISSLAAGVAVWALGELFDSHRVQAGTAAIDYQRATTVFRVAFNLAGLFLVVLALYRFWKFGFWPISELM
jgi:hypothetical protein